MRGDQIARVLKLVYLLRGNGRTLQQLRAELGVAKRTIQRDIQVLEETGFPVASEQRNHSIYWKLAYDPIAEAGIDLTHEERMALYFSRGLLKPLAGTPFFDAIESALAKIGAGISAPGHSLIKSFDRQVGIAAFGLKDFSRSRAVIAALTRAIQHHFTVTLTHATPQHKTAVRYQIDPYRLRYHEGGLYLFGLDQANGAIRTFAVERIGSASVTRSRFTPPPQETLDEMNSTAFQLIFGEPQLVRIRFSPAQAPYIAERQWHPSQLTERRPDGGLILSLQVGSLWEVKRWLFGWGSAAEVLEPLALREEIRIECLDTAVHHGHKVGQ
jgi:predicted DNA-binding transcriptional regulator YafY